mgnify:CR=1 FL=1
MLRTVGKKMKHEVMNPRGNEDLDIGQLRLKLGRYYGLSRPLNAQEVEAALEAYDIHRSWSPYDSFVV